MNTKLFTFLLLLSFITPLFITPASAQGSTMEFSQEALDFQKRFFEIVPDSFTFNGLEPATDGYIYNQSLGTSMRLEVTAGVPYDLEVRNLGNVQQTINGKTYTTFVWELYYTYTIQLITIGLRTVFPEVRQDKTVLLYHEGWGALPWTSGTGGGQTAYVTLTFEDYQLRDDWKNYLTTWGWYGALEYDMVINPQLLFPEQISVTEEGAWEFNETHFGFLETTLLYAEIGAAQNFSIYVEGAKAERVQETPSSQGAQLLMGPTGRGFISSGNRGYEASYDGFRIDTPLPNSPHSNKAPSNHTQAISKKVLTGEAISNPKPFTPTSLSLIDQQRRVRNRFIGVIIKPEVVVISGTHYYTYFDWFNGPLNEGLFTDFNREMHGERVVLGWEIYNAYQLWHLRTGVRIVSLYQWNATRFADNGLGEPQGKPNWDTGDAVYDGGVNGGLGAETPPSFFEKFWWIIAIIIGIVALVVVVKIIRPGGGGKAEVKIQQIIQSPPSGTEQKPAEKIG